MAELGIKKEDIVDLDATRHAEEVIIPIEAAVEEAEILAEEKVKDAVPFSILESAPFTSKSKKDVKPVKVAEPERQTVRLFH